MTYDLLMLIFNVFKKLEIWQAHKSSPIILFYKSGVQLQKLTLIRHGESVFNSQKKIQGKLDSSLTQTGISQTKLLSQHVKNENKNYDAIFSSPLKRAFETAHIISKHLELSLNVVENLKEINLGEWEGKFIEEIKKKESEAFENFISNPLKYFIPSGENPLDFQKRVVSSINNILNSDDENILIVSHAGTINVFLCHVLNLNLNYMWKMHIENTSITEIVFNNFLPRVVLFNDICHLNIKNLT